MDDRVHDSRISDGVAAFAAQRWNALNRNDNPFTDHRFLAALETSGCIRPEVGWQTQSIAIGDQALPLPAYLKENSHGEFVFDWAWADAAERSG
ncbi:MAG: peptidogalycan biosysnthesis protein, partial [Pseudomonadota bacterium]